MLVFANPMEAASPMATDANVLAVRPGLSVPSGDAMPQASAAHLRSIGIAPEAAHDDHVIYFHDTPPDVLAEVLSRGELEQSGTPMGQPWPLAAWPDIPTRVLAGREDRLFPAEFQQRVARERLGLGVQLLPGGHLLAWSHPAELAAVECVARPFEIDTRLDLDEGQHAATAGNDIDLAELGLVAPRQDRVAGEPQAPDRAPFGGVAEAMSLAASLDRHDTP